MIIPPSRERFRSWGKIGSSGRAGDLRVSGKGEGSDQTVAWVKSAKCITSNSVNSTGMYTNFIDEGKIGDLESWQAESMLVTKVSVTINAIFIVYMLFMIRNKDERRSKV